MRHEEWRIRMGPHKAASVEWSDRIRQLLADLKLTQAGLAERLGISPPTVSRWIQGRHEPTAEGYIALGNLVGRPDGVYFWERAGMHTAGLADASFVRATSSLRVGLEDLQLIAAARASRELADKGKAVAIPLLKVAAYGDRIPPHEDVNLSQVDVEEILVAPLSWCAHPDNMIGMHLAGDSMFPVISPDSIIFVDTAATDRDQLHQRIVVASHRDLGFKVARFQRLAGADLLISANHKCAPIDISNASRWKIQGEVLWWVSRDFDAAENSGEAKDAAAAD
jgi:transcriptional regulator with XRE-family HTH domain